MVDLKIELPDSFFQEEERDGYLVSSEMKSLWAIQLDLLCELDRVCEKHKIKFILDFGTLLGAVRHKGFIPWDDDLDVSMLRADYEKLMEVGPKEFKHPYFLQNQITDKNYDDYVTKLRRSDTSYLLNYNIDSYKRYKCRYNMGVFIDIFVYDNLPSDDEQAIQKIGDDNYNAMMKWFVLAHRPRISEGIMYLPRLLRYYMYKLRYKSCANAFMLQNDYAQHFEPSGYVGRITMPGKTNCRPKEWFETIVHMPFENIMMPVPKDYDALLTEAYGDYMTPVMGASGHELCCFDVNRSYQDVLLDMMKKQ